MIPEPNRGNILVVTDRDDQDSALSRRIRALGECPVVLNGSEKFLIQHGDDETVDLIVTDVDTTVPLARSLLVRLLDGTVFPGVPQLHIVRDPRFHDEMLSRNPAVAAVALAHPADLAELDARLRLAAEVGRLRRELARSSIRDDLTGLHNRRFVLLRLDQEFSRARRHRTPLSVAVFDIDGLKTVNRRYDAAIGDRVIRGVGSLLRLQCRKEDVLGRAGEESFVFLLPGSNHRGAAVLANKVRTACESLGIEIDDAAVEIRISAGISNYPGNVRIRNSSDLLAAAEEALGEAKARGGNRVHIDGEVIRRDGRLILIADPDPTLLDLAEDLLAVDDCRIVRAPNGAAALEALRTLQPDLLIIDLRMMADGSGETLFERIRSRLDPLPFPVIGLSREPEAAPDDPGGSGIDRLLTKPFSVSMLRSLARELVSE